MQSTEEISKSIQPSQADQPNATAVAVKPLSVLQINMGYEYEDNDINTLLEIKVKDILNVVGIINYVLGAGDNIVPNQLQRGIQDCINELRTKPSVQHTQYNLLIPFNLGCYHWVSLLIRLDANFKATKIVYCDSLKKVSQVPESITTAINKLWPNIPVTLVELLTQPDMKSCGVLAIVNLMNIIQERNNNKTLSEAEIQELRRSDLLLVKDKRPDYFDSFYQRQLANRSSIAAIPKQVAMLSQEVKFSPQEYKRIMQGYELIKDISDNNLKQILQACLKDKVEFNDKVHLYLQQIREGFNRVLSQKISHKDRDKENINRLISLFFGFEPGEAPLTDLSDNKFRLEHEELRMLGKLLNGEDIASLKEFTQAVDTQINADETYAKKLQEEYQRISYLSLSPSSAQPKNSFALNSVNPISPNVPPSSFATLSSSMQLPEVLQKSARVRAKGKLIGGNKADYARLRSTADDLIKLIPDPQQRLTYLREITLATFSDSIAQKPSGTVSATNNLLQFMQSLDVEGIAISGDKIDVTGIEVVSETKDQLVHIEVKELANKLDELLHHLTTPSNLTTSPEDKLLQEARNALDVHFKSNHRTQALDLKSSGQNASDNEPMDWEEICKRIYVESEATSLFTNDTRLLLKEELDEFVKDKNKRIAVIMGNPGAGKTTFAKQWLASCFAEYKNNSQHKPIPLFITLHEILKKTHGDPSKLLERYLNEEVGLSPNQISIIKAEQPLIVFCDGYDEVSFEGNLYQENHWHDWPKAKFVITTRPEKFGSLLNESELKEALVKAFSPTKVMHDKEIPTGLVIKSLCEFNKDNIKSFIEQWISHSKINWQMDMYLKALQEIPGLSELTSNPIILSLVLYTLPDIIKEQQQTLEQRRIERINIYDFFVKNWFNTQSDKVWRKLKELNSDLEKRLRKSLSELKKTDSNVKIDMAYFLRAYTTQLGYWCLQNSIEGKLRIEIPTQETLKGYLLPPQCRDVIATYLRDEKVSNLQEKTREATEAILMALRSGCLLKCDHEYFKFFHKSLVEYFAQEHIFRGVIGGLAFEKNCEQLNTQIVEPNLLRMLAERAQEDEAFAKYLYQVVRESKKTADVALAASNAITILNYAKRPLNIESWQGIRIPHADLSGAMLHCADFRGADLSYVNFRSCNLEEADMSESHITGCTWNLPTKINFKSKVTAVIYPNSDIGLVVGEASGQIHFIDLQSWTIEKTISHNNIFSSKIDAVIGLATDGDKSKCKSKLLASASRNGKIYLWELPSGKDLDKLSHQNVKCIALNTSGERLASGDRNKDIYVWDIIKKERIAILQGHADWVRSIAFSPDGKQLASGSHDKTVRLWDAIKLAPFATLQEHADSVWSISWSSDGKQLASGGWDNTVRVWDAVSFASLATLQGHTASVWSVSWSPDGKQLASGGWDNTVRVWDAVSFASLATLRGYTASVWSVSWSPDGKQLASGSSDKTVRLWDAMKFASLATLHEHGSEVWSVAFSPDGKQIASGSLDNTLRLWDTIIFAPLATLQGHTDSIWSVTFSPDGKQLASGSKDKTVRLWDAIKFVPLGILEGHTNWVRGVAFSPDGKRLASGSEDRTIRLWDAIKFVPLATLKGHTDRVCSVIFSPDSKQLASGSEDTTVRLWDAVNFVPLAILEGHTNWVRSVAFSPDGKQLASGSMDYTVRLWDAVNYTPLATLNGHTGYVWSLTWSQDGKQLVSGGGDGTVRLWEINAGKCVKIMHCGFSIKDIKFVDDRLLIGGNENNIVHSLIYQKNDQQRYVLITSTIKNIPVVDKLNLEKTKGLTVKQHKFLINQGAVGKPARFSYVNVTDKELDDEKGHLKQLQTIKQMLQRYRETSLQVNSLFDTKTTISFQSWSIYLYRVTKPSMGNSGSNSSNGNRHVYGLLEGLDQLGKRILIRFDLVEDNSNKSYARVKIKNKIIENHHEPQSQNGFYELSQSEGRPDPTEIVCFRAGTLDLKELDSLLDKIIEEMQRQLQPDANRISYKFLGGDEGVGDAHNCLTWLRYLLKEYKNVKIPRGTFELFGADPKAILPESRGFGIFASGELPEGVKKIDISAWEHKLQENAHLSKRQNR